MKQRDPEATKEEDSRLGEETEKGRSGTGDCDYAYGSLPALHRQAPKRSLLRTDA
jgi:hypothetical protein